MKEKEKERQENQENQEKQEERKERIEQIGKQLENVLERINIVIRKVGLLKEHLYNMRIHVNSCIETVKEIEGIRIQGICPFCKEPIGLEQAGIYIGKGLYAHSLCHAKTKVN